jgi:glycosyltransferase involved in cell wall biosynthesis
VSEPTRCGQLEHNLATGAPVNYFLPVSVSVIVRVRDEAEPLERCLTLIGAQTGAGSGAELVVVDNDSADDSAAVARRHGAQVIRISHERFSFGRALNLGASVAHSSLLVALSAHAYVDDPRWLDRIVARFADPSVACVSGERLWPDGSPLRRPVRYDARLAAGYPRWGYSNAAGAFRADLWSQRHFREDLGAAEDREWGRWWALERNRVTVLDPDLCVDHDHTHDPMADIFTRSRREAVAFTQFLGPAETADSLWHQWFWDTRYYANPWRARLSHRRLARILGERVGVLEARAGQRARATPNSRARTLPRIGAQARRSSQHIGPTPEGRRHGADEES